MANVMITGTGRSCALGYNLVLRYLECGDVVIATVRKKSDELEALKNIYGDKLIILIMDIGSTESVQAAQRELSEKVEHIDTLINNAEMSLIINISSEAGSISKCWRTNAIEYGMAKAALNMATMNLALLFKDSDKVNIFCVHPGWIRTDGKPDNKAPLASYEAAEILRKLFDEKRFDKTGPRFITNEGEAYPF